MATNVIKTSVKKPKIILPSNYSLTLSEGEVVKITGDSSNINDYKIIYAKVPCDVANAVSGYTSQNAYYAASAADLKKKLMDNAIGTADYYVLKDFDQKSTFITKDPNDSKSFYLRTPSTTEYSSINDFYVLQWFKNVEPGDLIYLYAIQRGTETTTTIVEGVDEVKCYTGEDWTCRCCNSKVYYYWVRGSYSPYTKFSIDRNFVNDLKNKYDKEDIKIQITIRTGTTIDYPPDIYMSDRRLLMHQTYYPPSYKLASIGSSNGRVFTYNIPIDSFLSCLSTNGTTVVFNSEWGKNTYDYCYFISGTVLEVKIKKEGSTTSTSKIGYSDGNYNSINKIPLTDMTPYVVIPPAVRPVELALKEVSTTKATIVYDNPLYDLETGATPEYTKIGHSYISVKEGNDINNYSDLNQSDNTLYLGQLEKRLETYEKSIKMPTAVLNYLKGSKQNNSLYIDLNIKSIDGNKINFNNIVSSEDEKMKFQVMFSKSGKNKIRAIDLNSKNIDLKQTEYTFDKIILDQNTLSAYDTIHILYNLKRYDEGKYYKTKDWKMQLDSRGQVVSSIGWRKIGSNIGACSFKVDTHEIALYATGSYNSKSPEYKYYKIRLCLENLDAASHLFAPPNIVVEDTKKKQTVLKPITTGEVKINSDVFYEIPASLFDVKVDDTLTFYMEPKSPYPANIPEIDFSNAYIEVIGLKEPNEDLIRYSTGFEVDIAYHNNKVNISNSNQSIYDAVQCIDVIMCCYNSNKQLINKISTNFRDIYNGKEIVYYTSRQWHNLVNNRHKSHNKYKKTYEMTFDVPDNTEHICFIAFTYGNWRNNPSIYSMSNILSANSIKQDMSLQFTKPVPTKNASTGEFYATTNINNPDISVKVNVKKGSNASVTSKLVNGGFNLVKDVYDDAKWKKTPIIYSNNKKYGYELPRFLSSNVYHQNNVISSLEPLYNDIEFYWHWKDVYGKNPVPVTDPDGTINDLVDIETTYTIYEDAGDKFISNNAIPYIEIPAELVSHDRSKFTLFLDTNFGLGRPVEEEKYKYVTEVYTENYTISYIRGRYGVLNFWTSKIMEAFMDIAEIVDIKVEWGMKVNANVTIPKSGIPGPTLTEDLYYDFDSAYNYNAASLYPEECSGDRIMEKQGASTYFTSASTYKYFEITNPRIKRLFLEWNSHRRRHDAIRFNSDFKMNQWNKIVNVRYTITRKVNKDGSRLYKRQNLPSEHYSSETWVPGWEMYSMPKFKVDNFKFKKYPTEEDRSFVMTYDVLLSPVIFYYKDNMTRGDSLGNKYKYTWGDNAEAYMTWETVTVQGTIPKGSDYYTYTKTHYYIAYQKEHTVYKSFTLRIYNDGTVKQQ